jgi:hypothetical protein
MIAEVEAGRQPRLKNLLSAGIIEVASLSGLEYA